MDLKWGVLPHFLYAYFISCVLVLANIQKAYFYSLVRFFRKISKTIPRYYFAPQLSGMI